MSKKILVVAVAIVTVLLGGCSSAGGEYSGGFSGDAKETHTTHH